VIETDIYNPCLPGSRFGESAQTMPKELPEGLEGLHFHALCESSSYDLEKVIEAFEAQFGPYIDKVKWVNMGGGHLMTKAGYDTDHLVKVLKAFRSRHNGVKVILEPGSAFTWRTGDLIASVLDIVENSGIKTAILDTSFACHMPDCLEMPYTPTITEALPEGSTSGFEYRLGGNSCLSGDFMRGFHFPSPLHVGQRLTFEDMNHYTTVKTHMFNGIQHPSIWLQPIDGEPQLLRQFTYEDYRDRMD
jgi:carboxynorspermidine decarboxylase